MLFSECFAEDPSSLRRQRAKLTIGIKSRGDPVKQGKSEHDDDQRDNGQPSPDEGQVGMSGHLGGYA